MELTPTLILNLALLIVPPVAMVQLAATGAAAFRIYNKQRKG